MSNPTLGAMDALSRLSHDTDAEVAQNAVLALGECPVLKLHAWKEGAECVLLVSKPVFLLCKRLWLPSNGCPHGLSHPQVCRDTVREVAG